MGSALGRTDVTLGRKPSIALTFFLRMLFVFLRGFLKMRNVYLYFGFRLVATVTVSKDKRGSASRRRHVILWRKPSIALTFSCVCFSCEDFQKMGHVYSCFGLRLVATVNVSKILI